MPELRVLITCRHVWEHEDTVSARLAAEGIVAHVPRFDGQQMEEPDLIPILHDYEGILAGDDHLTRSVLESAPNLRVISKWGIGVDAIDHEAARDLGIAVFNTPGVFGEELADYAMGFVHLLARRQHEVNARVRSGDWHQVRGVSLLGRTMGIIGLGSSGSAPARRAIAASMRVIASDVVEVAPVEGVEIVPLDALLAEADVVSLHIPATAETRHLIDQRSLSQMRLGAWLINTSRGALVDEDALVAALRSGHLGAAALDVFEREPVAPDNPLLAFDNVIVGSHNGSNTEEAVRRTTQLAVTNLILGLKGS